MRHETQRWNNISVNLEVITLGVGQTGLSPTVAVQRVTDGKYLPAVGAWQVAYTTLTLTELDAVNLPGAYRRMLSIPPEVNPDDRYNFLKPGVLLKIMEPVNSILEYVMVHVEENLFMEEVDSDLGASYLKLDELVHGIFRAVQVHDDAYAANRYWADAGSAVNEFIVTGISQTGAADRYTRRLCVLKDVAAGTYMPVQVNSVSTAIPGQVSLFLSPVYPGAAISVTAGDELVVTAETGSKIVGAMEDDTITDPVMNASALEAIADYVWEEDLSGHALPGTAGTFLDATADLPLADENADAVWNEAIADHSGVVGSTAEALSNAVLSPTAVADAVWDAAIAGHLDPASTGEALNNASDAASPAEVADAVWDEVKTGHSIANSFGRMLQVTAGLVQQNQRIKDATYDPAGRLLTCKLVVYPTPADASADTNAVATLNVTATYDVDGNLATYLSRE